MKPIILIVTAFFPTILFAATTIAGFLDEITNLFKVLIPITASLAVLFFFYGIARFILAGGDEKNIEEGKRFMKWGVLALFIIFSVEGILTVMQVFFFGGPFGHDLKVDPNP